MFHGCQGLGMEAVSGVSVVINVLWSFNGLEPGGPEWIRK